MSKFLLMFACAMVVGLCFDPASAQKNVWQPLNNGLSNLDVRSIAIHPGNPDILYIGTGDGVFKSTNKGNSWESSSVGLVSKKMGDVVIDPNNPNVLCAGTEEADVHKPCPQITNESY